MDTNAFGSVKSNFHAVFIKLEIKSVLKKPNIIQQNKICSDNKAENEVKREINVLSFGRISKKKQ